MAKLIPDAYLRATSLAGQGERIHAVKITDDPKPLAHLHGIRRTLCGLRSQAKPAYWPTDGAAVHGTRCGTCARLIPADWRPPARRRCARHTIYHADCDDCREAPLGGRRG